VKLEISYMFLKRGSSKPSSTTLPMDLVLFAWEHLHRLVLLCNPFSWWDKIISIQKKMESGLFVGSQKLCYWSGW